MGAYIYRVTAKVVKLVGGRKAHVAQYAYKPYHSRSMEKENARAHFRTGCVASEKLKLKSDLLITLNKAGTAGTLYHNPQGIRVFYDDNTFGTAVMPNLGEIEVWA